MTQYDKVLVTGGSGRVGRRLVESLKSRCQVTVFDSRPPAANVGYIEGDLLDLDAVRRAAAGQDAIIHLAAALMFHKLPDEKLVAINVQGTWQVMQAALDAGVRKVVHCSSECTTGVVIPDPSRPPRYLPVDEDHPCYPAEPYGISKLAAERVAESFARRGAFPVSVVRPVLVATETVSGSLAERGRDPKNIDLWGWVDPMDVAEAFRLALEHDGRPYEVFFASAPNTLSDTPTLDLVRAYYGHLPEIRKPELYRHNPTAAIFDIARARERLGFAPHSDWRRLQT
jgi:nucleoside-diphosphate-sugar epimerase